MAARRSAWAVGWVALVCALVASPTAATAKGGQVGGSGQEYYLNDTWSTDANHKFRQGLASDEVYVGDWDGDGDDTLAVRRGATFILYDTLGGPASRTFVYGGTGDVVLVGDWNGDGTDTFAVRRGNEYHVKNSLGAGAADWVFIYGKPTDSVLVGDWDGDGDDTLAVRRANQYHVKHTLSAGAADQVVIYGRPTDTVLVGDWDGDGDDSFTVRRGSHYYIANAIRAGAADRTLIYGRPSDWALTGDWNGDGTDSLGVRRESDFASQRQWLTDALNNYRLTNGRTVLARDLHLDEVAQRHARWMAENEKIEHNPDRQAEVGPGYWMSSEILVRNTGARWLTEEEVLTSLHHWWRGSAVHNENMLRATFTHVGTGYYLSEDGVPYAIHVLGAK